MQIQDITIGQIWGLLVIIIGISATIGGAVGKWKEQKKDFSKKLYAPFEQKITNLEEKITNLMKDQDLRNCRTQLIQGFNELRHAAELDQEVSEVYIQNLHDLYSHYCELGGNSYVHSEFEKLKKEGLL